MGNTIGGVVFNLCKECGETLKEGKVFKIADAEVTILALEMALLRIKGNKN